jgi:hypothetical protein
MSTDGPTRTRKLRIDPGDALAARDAAGELGVQTVGRVDEVHLRRRARCALTPGTGYVGESGFEPANGHSPAHAGTEVDRDTHRR